MEIEPAFVRAKSALRQDSARASPVPSVRSLNNQAVRSFAPDASIVLVGSRGSGKRSLGFIAATHLGRRFITEDYYFNEVSGISRAEFLRKNGSEAFAKQNVETMRRMLGDNKSNCVIECGMGSLAREAQVLLREHCKTHPVIYVLRNLDRIRNLLNLEENNANRLAKGDLTHRLCSNLEYYNLHDSSGDETSEEGSPGDRASPSYSSRLVDAKQDFSHFVDQITGRGLRRNESGDPFSVGAVPTESRLYTHSLSVKLSELVSRNVDLEDLESGVDAIELRLDTQFPDFLRVISKRIAVIRRKLEIPIILNIDESLLEGRKQEQSTEDIYFNLLHHGLRLGVEYLVVDLTSREGSIQQLVSGKGRTKIIGHFFEKTNASSWRDQSRLDTYLRGERLGCDIIRMVQSATARKDNGEVMGFRAMIDNLPGTKRPPIIAYNLGAIGRTSVIFNPTLSPVTHPALQAKSKNLADESLVTAHDAMQALYQSYVLDPLQFYIIGAHVFYSLSPAMHNAAYEICGLKNNYQIHQTSSLDELRRISQEINFGGASVSLPFKVDLVAHMQAKSNHVKIIGACNTILPLRALPDGTVPPIHDQARLRSTAGPVVGSFGDNTDFIGIMTCLRRHISPRNTIQPSKTTGLVIGAGGMARAAVYAMVQLGCRKIYMHNRTIANAQKVADHFNEWARTTLNCEAAVTVLPSRHVPWPEKMQPPTMIVACIPVHYVSPPFEMPQAWLSSSTGGVVIELAYKPLNTPLLKQIRRLRTETGLPWVTVDGLEILPEQGIAQFELMTGKKAPRARMRLECLRNYQGEEGQYHEPSLEGL